MGVEETIKEVAGELERIASTKTVVGDPIIAADKTIIPISKISMGFGAGGGEGKREKESGYGGGGGAGAKIDPVAFIVVSKEDTRIFRISEKSDVGKFLEAVPDIVPEVMEKIKAVRDKVKKCDKGESSESSEKGGSEEIMVSGEEEEKCCG